MNLSDDFNAQAYFASEDSGLRARLAAEEQKSKALLELLIAERGFTEASYDAMGERMFASREDYIAFMNGLRLRVSNALARCKELGITGVEGMTE